MSEEHLIEKEVEDCTTLREMVREVVDQVKTEYDDFKEKLKASIDSS